MEDKKIISPRYI